MRSTLYTTWIGLLGVLCVAAPLVLAADQTAGQPPHAKIVTVEGAATTWQVEGMYGQTVTVEVPTHAMTDIKLSDPAHATVPGTVVSLDGETNRVKVHTKEGQMVVLEMPHETIMRMRLGDTFTLAVPRPAGR